ncbi:MAG: DUF3846 domain-containing protein [Bacteroidales bacterium]|jgi:hypothetical protein|nr:DUF3846 domain-containing protein [Bacteroidales bacterium]
MDKPEQGYIRVLLVEPLMPPVEMIMPAKLEAYQKVVGGLIEVAYPFDRDAKMVAICNEEGKLLDLPLNRSIEYDIIAGTFIVCGTDPETGDFASLTDEQMKQAKERFGPIEIFSVELVYEVDRKTGDIKFHRPEDRGR